MTREDADSSGAAFDGGVLLTYRGVVYPWHCDHMGHMNVMWYTGKFDEATWQLFSRIGLSSIRLRALDRGMVAAEQNIQYRKEVLAGDGVTIRSRIVKITERSMHFEHEMYRDSDDQLAAVSSLVGVHIGLVTRRSEPLPADVVALASTWRKA